MGARFSAPVQTGLEAHQVSCTMGTGSFQGVKSGRGVTLTPHPILVPWSSKSRAIPLLPLWAVRPVQSLSACTRVTFTFLCEIYTNKMRHHTNEHQYKPKVTGRTVPSEGPDDCVTSPTTAQASLFFAPGRPMYVCATVPQHLRQYVFVLGVLRTI